MQKIVCIMKKVFTINLNFQNATYTALVNLRQAGRDLRCFVHYLDNDLHCILPGKGLVLSLSEGLMRTNKKLDELATRLVSVTAEAITNYIQLEQNY
ncbi:MAG: hypothetical protein ICV82_10185 [Nitrososphaera sp.]|nr:hypothetical protein [Nitrososphaera sp.]